VLGVGKSLVGNYGETPELEGFTDRELLSWACQAAYDDAGIRARDVEKVVFCLVCNFFQGQAIAGHHMYSAWTGCEGKPFSHHEEACCTAYYGLGEGIEAIASGKYDIVLVCGQDTANTYYKSNELPLVQNPAMEFMLGEGFPWKLHADFLMQDAAYYRWNGAAYGSGVELGGFYYMEDYGKTLEEMDDYLNAISYNERYNACHNPNAYIRESFDDLAKKHGFETAMEYLRSDHNPKMGTFLRRAGMLKHVTGGAATILCSEDVAKQSKRKSVQVLGTGFSTIPFHIDRSYNKMNKYIRDSAFGQAGISPEEIEYFQCTDMTTLEVLYSSEDMGYLPAGEGWKYHLENRTTFEGDKPINTNGGSQNNGHILGTSGLSSLHEVITQMRGEAGERQIKKVPQTSLMRGHGGSHSTAAFIFRS